jgi:hypothetical protein
MREQQDQKQDQGDSKEKITVKRFSRSPLTNILLSLFVVLVLLF